MKNKRLWNSYVKKNDDPYGKACVLVAQRVMELLDKDKTPLHDGYFPDVHTPHGLICQADHDTNAGGITGFMAGCVASMVWKCHERGDEFRIIFNGESESDGIVNPALVTLDI
jgi:hypothetical protein